MLLHILAFIGAAFVVSLCFVVLLGFVIRTFKPGDVP